MLVHTSQEDPTEMNTNEWLYQNNVANTLRYVLGEKSENMVACIGINPSTAEPNALDNTLKSVKRIAQFNGFDGWVMYNLYPQRATDPNELHHEIDEGLHLKNIEILRQSIQDLGIDTVWLAYGDLIESRNYLPYCLLSLYTYLRPLELKWKIIAEPTQKGHPRHPLYKPSHSSFVDFDLDNYMNEKLKLQTT
ncbi:MAG: DUF1643 domain-containing protein [Maribacter sp.]